MSKILRAYLRFWAKQYLKRVKPQIVGVTGSVGKTSAKDAIFEVLKEEFGEDVRKSEGNLNNETGLPCAVLGFESAPSFGESRLGWFPIILKAPFKAFFGKKVKHLVLEYSADKPGDIKYLTTFAQPKIAVLTSIGPAHLEAFGSIDRIVEEKTDLLRALPHEGVSILNLGNDEVKKASYGGRWQKITYSAEGEGDYQASNIVVGINKFTPFTKFKLSGKEESFDVNLAIFGRHFVYAALAAVAVGRTLNISWGNIIKGLENFRPSKHRMDVFKGRDQSVIIDDCYNANPVSMKASLEMLHNLNGKRKIAILGDMLELGKISEDAHKLIGEYAKEVADMVIGVGHYAKLYHGQKYFKNKEVALEFVLKEAKPGDIILIKASRGIGLETIAEALRA